MASYDLVDQTVTNFEFKLADWGTAGQNHTFYGGTPGYASKHMFLGAYKDYFSIGRLAMELFVNKTRTVKNATVINNSVLYLICFHKTLF